MITELKTAAAYIRVSTDDQVELSPESQLSVIRDYAKREGYVLPDEFIFMDEGISGRSVGKRDAFIRMIATAKQPEKPFDAILLWTFSRFARNQEESVVYKSLLRKKLGIDVISVSEPLAEGVYGSLIERIIEWMDEYYSIRLSDEVKRSMTVKARKGELQSTPSFGYRVENNMLVPVPAEAQLIRDIFGWFIAGEGCYPIAKKLNDMGIRTHRGNKFENRTVEYILRNPVYIGKLRWNPSGRTRRNYDDENIILADAKHEPLIDMDTWEAAQRRMAEIKGIWGYKARPTYELKDWLSGIVRCSNCGATLVFVRPHFFKCNNYAKGMCSVSQHVKTDVLHEALIARLKSDASSRQPIDFKIVRYETESDPVAQLQRQLDSISRKQSRIREAYLAGIDSLDEYREYKKALAEEEATVKAKIAAAENSIAPEAAAGILRDNISNTVGTLSDPSASLEEKNNAVRSILESCIWDKASATLKLVYRLLIN